MFSQTYIKKTTEVIIDDIWKVWSDVNNWHTWHDDIEYAKLDGKFCAGNSFMLKPKGMKAVRIKLIQVEENKKFVDLTVFPLAKMYGIHEFVINNDTLEIKTTMKVTGILAFFWWQVVGKKIANDEESQTNSLIARIKYLKKLQS